MIGQNVRRAGEFKFCWAIGWYVEEYARAADFHEPDELPRHAAALVLERARQLAADRGLSGHRQRDWSA